MTNGNLKKAVRLRMAQTGEKYTTALRALQEDPAERSRLNGLLMAERLARREQEGKAEETGEAAGK